MNKRKKTGGFFMRKIRILIIIMCLLGLGVQNVWPGSAFKFPASIKYKLLKNDKVVGSCKLTYSEKGKLQDTSTLKLINFEGLGITSQEWLLTYILKKDSSIYANFTMKGQKPISQIRLVKGMGFDGKTGQVFKYEKPNSPDEMQTEIFTTHPVIDLISSFFVISQKVAHGEHSTSQKFNFLFGKSTKIMNMMYMGDEDVPFSGKMVSAYVLVITYNNREIFRFKISREDKDCYFPVSVILVTDFTENTQETLELRADEVLK
jgi:hypothetical protein